MFKQLTVIGPGLIGASILKAAKSYNVAGKRVAWARREATRQACLDQSIADEAPDDLSEAVRGADLILICTSVESIPEYFKAIYPSLAPETIVSDVGSIKAAICEDCQKIDTQAAFFIGSHPMAGSEKSGLDHADDQLFQNRHCFITPTPSTKQDKLKKLEAFWESIGMRTSLKAPKEHDQIVAAISHLPHLIASALCGTLSEMPNEWAQYGGGGLRDTSRIAAGDPHLWEGIFHLNSESLHAASELFTDTLKQITMALESNDRETVKNMLQSAAEYRKALP